MYRRLLCGPLHLVNSFVAVFRARDDDVHVCFFLSFFLLLSFWKGLIAR